ncbi:core histone macro-H2A.1 [Trichonephila clavipes]|nr:core histone macro-H2A.1 [Trichonephila clavipes]
MSEWDYTNERVLFGMDLNGDFEWVCLIITSQNIYGRAPTIILLTMRPSRPFVKIRCHAVPSTRKRSAVRNFTPNAAVLFVDVAIQPEVRFITKQNSLRKIRNNGNLVLGPFDESTPCLMIVLMNCQTKLRINHLTAVKSVAILEKGEDIKHPYSTHSVVLNVDISLNPSSDYFIATGTKYTTPNKALVERGITYPSSSTILHPSTPVTTMLP